MYYHSLTSSSSGTRVRVSLSMSNALMTYVSEGFALATTNVFEQAVSAIAGKDKYTINYQRMEHRS